MQIWRMKADGTEPEQVTNDECNNWFPHISPDGQWIAFISFPKEVDPTDHPYYKRVYLRLMPVAGGDAEGDRVRLRRAGDDQRAVVVAGRADARVRQQYGELLKKLLGLFVALVAAGGRGRRAEGCSRDRRQRAAATRTDAA